jgi:hypothetical protein
VLYTVTGLVTEVPTTSVSGQAAAWAEDDRAATPKRSVMTTQSKYVEVRVIRLGGMGDLSPWGSAVVTGVRRATSPDLLAGPWADPVITGHGRLFISFI